MSPETRVPPPPKLNCIHFFGPGTFGEPAGPEVLGGKGFSLAAMSKAGLAVPPGFVICTDCCHVYHTERKRWPGGLEAEVRAALNWLEAVMGRKLGLGPKPLLVSVRSGAAVSMPGMMDTVLNVGLHAGLESFYPDKEGFWIAYRDFVQLYGETVSGVEEKSFAEAAAGAAAGAGARERAQAAVAAYRRSAKREFPADPWTMLCEAISAVFESWNSERAITYRERHDIRGLPGTAVTVQAMFPSQTSGVLFTADPNAPESGKIIIEAACGLGEAIVRGRVEPDVYIVDRQTLRVTERKVSDKDVSVRALSESGSAWQPDTDGACLTNAQVEELGRLGLAVEKHFGFPVDVEWGWADGRFGLLQSRRIRGLDVARDLAAARGEEINRVRELARKYGPGPSQWVLYNLAETLKSPTPLTWDIIGRFMGGSGGFLQMYRDLGYFPSELVRREGMLDLLGGRIYAHLGRHAEIFYDRWPHEYDPASAESLTAMLEARPSKFNFERAGMGFLARLPLYVFKMIRQGRRMRRTARRCLDEFTGKVVPEFMQYANRAWGRQLAELSDAEVLAELAEREAAFNQIGRHAETTSSIAGYYHGRLLGTLEAVLGAAPGQALAARLLGGLDGDKTMQQNIDLYRVAAGELTIEQFLEEYGHRAAGEFELAEPRWREDSSYLRQQVETFRKALGGKNPHDSHEQQKVLRLQAERELGRILAEHAASSLEDDTRQDLAGAQRYLPWRETSKYYYMMAYALIREAIEELSRRWDLGRDIYFLRREELGRFAAERERLKNEVIRRKVRWQALQRLDMPEMISSEDAEAVGRPEEITGSQDGVFSGKGVAAGVETGVARIVKSPQEAGDLGPNYVLVCTSTDPGWTPLFVRARGVIVERGGMLSHGAIVARDFGIPAVVLKNATKLIPDGAEIRIDGNRGRVEIVGAELARRKEA